MGKQITIIIINVSIFVSFVCVVLRFKLRALRMLGKLSATELWNPLVSGLHLLFYLLFGVSFISVSFFLRQDLTITHTGLECFIYSRLVSNSPSSCLSLRRLKLQECAFMTINNGPDE